MVFGPFCCYLTFSGLLSSNFHMRTLVFAIAAVGFIVLLVAPLVADLLAPITATVR
jgi:hypothetical protein